MDQVWKVRASSALLMILVGVQGARAGDYFTPVDMANKENPFRIEVTLRGNMVEFKLSIEGDTYSMMHRAHNILKVREDRTLISSVGVVPTASDGELNYSFNVRREFLASSTFMFRFGDRYGDRYKIRLADWFTIGDPFSTELDLDGTSVQQGQAVRGRLKGTSIEHAVLGFPSDCIIEYEIFRNDGENIPRGILLCGDMCTNLDFQAGEVKEIPFKISTFVGSETAGVELDEGFLPAGRYSLVIFVRGFRHLGLEGTVEIEVTQR